MGLDMYVYRVKKPELDSNKTYEWDDLTGFRCPIDEVEPYVSQIIPFCQKVHTRSIVIDMEEIRKDYELSNRACIVAASGDEMIFGDGQRGKARKDVRISMEIIRKKYTKTVEFDTWFCELTEVHYWRKAYSVSDWMNATIAGGTENCGFYLLTEEMILDHNEMFPEDPIEEEYSYEEPLFYHEWY